MKQQTLALFGLTVMLGIALQRDALSQAGPNLIVAGRSIGRIRLDREGARYLKRLPKPNAEDAGMSQTRQVWVSKTQSGHRDTLFIHTVSNGALGVEPLDGLTINLIRVTSPWYRTPDGLSTGATLAQIRRSFPSVLATSRTGNVYDDAKRGIAFEFARTATAGSSCIAIMIHPSGETHVATAQQVNSILGQGSHP